MKFTIYKEQVKEPKEKEICLRLINHEDTFYIIACDPETGERLNRGYLVEFCSNGTIYRHPAINVSLGFDLNSQGRIKDSTPV